MFLSGSGDAQQISQEDAAATLRQVVSFYRTQVGYQGAYLWRYSADLKHFEGEDIAMRTSGWTQPPGAPFVGETYLKCWRLTDDDLFRDAAAEVAHALLRAQLKSGGWSSHFELGPDGRNRYAYRAEGDQAGKNNRTTFDDNKSQSALMLLMHVDEALVFSDAKIHEGIEYALQNMLAAQYPNGAWPQQYTQPPNPDDFPVLTASYPESWKRTWPDLNYTDYYTLNDNNISHIITMLLEAERIYGRTDCREAAVHTGDFLLLAQMPHPQPGWAQQYDRQMHPAWARKFEPPAVCGGESQDVMRSLMQLYRHTGDKRFVATLPAAIDYYRRSTLPDGRLARFHELGTNRPLYFTKTYDLTYSDADVPTHYGFKSQSAIDEIDNQYQRLLTLPESELKPVRKHVNPVPLTDHIRDKGLAAIRSLDDRGAWVEKGTMRHQNEPLAVINMRTYCRNLEHVAAWAGAR